MNVSTLTTTDSIELKYAHFTARPDKGWIVLIIPFGLDVSMAKPFFEFFSSHYNVCTWSSRCILENSTRECAVAEFSIEHHVADLVAVLDELRIETAVMVGYCSGAGIALAGINQYPERFSGLVLAHGEYTLLQDALSTTPFAADMDVLLCLAAGSEERARQVFQKIQTERFEALGNRPIGLDRPFSDLRFLRRYASNYLAYRAADFERLAAQVSHSTLLLAGGKDIQVNIHSSRKIHSLMRQARLSVDPEADHYGVLRKDSNTLATIWNFLCEHAHA
jgi:pimeloyl-ACP methyl ester carboxylesterase